MRLGRAVLGGGVVVATLVGALAAVDCVDTGGLAGAGSSDAEPEGSSADADAGQASDGDAATSNGLGPLWLAYAGNTGKIGVRTWNAATASWSAEIAGPDLGSGAVARWVVAKATPTGAFIGVLTTVGGGGRVTVFQRAQDGSWSESVGVPLGIATRRTFDIDYEATTGELLLAYGGDSSVKFRRHSAGGWSAEAEVPLPSGGNQPPQWVDLVRMPVGNELSLLYADSSKALVASRWNGTAWSTAPKILEGNVNDLDQLTFSGAYESASGNFLAVWGRDYPVDPDAGPSNGMLWASRLAGSDTFSTPRAELFGVPPGHIALASEAISNRIALAYVEDNCNRAAQGCDDFYTGVWTGSAFSALATRDGNTTTLYGKGVFTSGVAWLGTDGVAIAAYHRDLPGDAGLLPFVRYATGSWGTVEGALTTPPLPPRASLALFTAPGPEIVALALDTQGALWAKGYRETTSAQWTDVDRGTPLATGLVSSQGVPFSVTLP